MDGKKNSLKRKSDGETTNYDIYLEIQKVRLDFKRLKELVLQALDELGVNGDCDTLKSNLPFELPLTKENIPICEEFLQNPENMELLVSNFLFDIFFFDFHNKMRLVALKTI